MRGLLPNSVDVTWGILVAIPLFLLFFLGLLFWTYSKRRKAVYEEIEKLPLEED